MSVASPLIQSHEPGLTETTPTGVLYESWRKSGVEPFVKGASRSYCDSSMDRWEQSLCEASHYGTLSFMDKGKQDDGTFSHKANVSLDEFYDRMQHDPAMEVVNHFFSKIRKHKDPYNDRRLMEHTMDAIDNSMLSRFLETVPRLGSWELCSGPDVNPILSLVQPISVGCGQTRLATDPALPRIDLDCFAPDEETPFYGLEPPMELLLPERCKLKLAFAYKRDLCVDFRGAVERQMRRGSQILSEAAARHIIQMMFNLYPPGEDPWEFNMDGIVWSPWYWVGRADSPYENMIFNATVDLDDMCNWAPFEVIEDLADEVFCPLDGRPMENCGTKTIVALDKRSARRLSLLLGTPMEFALTTGRGCSERIAFNRPAGSETEGWDPNVITNRWITDIAKERLAALNPTWTDAQLAEAMRRTFYAGCPRETFAWQIEWEREQCIRSASGAGCQTWEGFNQEIIWAVKFMEKVGGAYLNPWASWLYMGAPDGTPAPDPDVSEDPNFDPPV